MEERTTFRHVHAITGTFVLVVVAVLIATIVLAGINQRWFIRNVTLQIVLPESGAAGIRQGSEVYFLGTLVGGIIDVRIAPNGRMAARAYIRQDFFHFMDSDASTVVKKKFGVVGDSYVEIARGHGQPLPLRGASIVCHEPPPSPLETAVEDIRREALPALKKLSAGLDTWTTLGSNLITTRERLDQLIIRVDNITSSVQQGKGTVGNLMTDPSVADELRDILGQANHSFEELQVTLENLQSASGNLQAASTNLPAISANISKGAKDIPSLVLQTQVSMRELERLIEAAQRIWLIRRHVDWANPPLPSLEEPQSKKHLSTTLDSPKGPAK
jgi:phospholipid/cholesterol/gamma-HCH transport system substrate-binding protein